MKDIVFSNLSEIVKNKEVIGEKQTHDVWSPIAYETAFVQGTGFITTDRGLPDALILAPNLTGWHKIYIAALNMSGETLFEVKLDNEDVFTILSSSRGKPVPKNWTETEQVREMFFTCADLSDREIILRKNKFYSSITSIAWIRFSVSS